MNTEVEIWKDIAGFEGKYFISNLGRVKSFSFKSKSGRILAQQTNHSGYFYVNFYKGGKLLKHRTHRLVCAAFHNNPENKLTANHKDGNKKNNHHSNLEWATQSENIRHSYDTGLVLGASKICQDDVKNILKIWGEDGLTYSEIALKIGVSNGIVARVIRKETWVRDDVKEVNKLNWSYCHTCKKQFSNKVIHTHKLNHRKSLTDCKITFGRGETKEFKFTALQQINK